jgi:valyl-tRNA synthetase
LDTWFTSWLWPFAALGWPEETSDLAGYYPASLLVTARDIMFFWVARMLFAGFYFTGQAPFGDVYFTGMLRDEEGRRMSKHLGNSPDPIVLIRNHGADAVRVGLLFPNPVDQDSAFGSATIEQARRFLTKIWNLVRFAQPHFPPGTPGTPSPPSLGREAPLEDRWILSRWASTLSAVDNALGGYEPTAALGLLYGFLWHDLADRYIESVKERLSGRAGEPAARAARLTLQFLLDQSLRALHPFAPHVTEELWHAIPHEGESLAVAEWPVVHAAHRDPESEVAMERVWDAIRGLRGIKAEQHIPVSTLPRAWVVPSSDESRTLFEQHRTLIARLGRLEEFAILAPGAPRPANAAAAVSESGEFFVALPAQSPADRAALTREREKLEELLRRTQARLEDVRFRSQAPEEVIRETEAKATDLMDRIRRLDANLMVSEGEGAA